MKNAIVILFLSVSVFTAQEVPYGRVTDFDGNVYKTIVIGKYEWMAENLRTTSYNDGTEIPNITEDSVWMNLTSGAYCWFDNNRSNAETYGALYNWYAVDTKKLCPKGWRIPTDEEWKYLEGYVDTYYEIGSTIWNKANSRGYDAGRQIKNSFGWNSEGNGPNKFGFSAVPGGERLVRDGRFYIMGSNGFYWTSTEFGKNDAWFRNIIYAFDDILRYTHNKGHGFSVRCIRNR